MVSLLHDNDQRQTTAGALVVVVGSKFIHPVIDGFHYGVNNTKFSNFLKDLRP
jgi:hypothetical protein